MAKIGNQIFDQGFFNNYVENIFGEAFSHSSLSTEKLFEECNKYSLQLKTFMSESNREFYNKLVNSDKEEDIKLLNQRIQDIKDYLICIKNVNVSKTVDENNEKIYSIEDFEKFFPYIVRPFRNTKEYDEALVNAQVCGKRYESESLISRIELLYTILSKKLIADKKAYNCKKDNNNAFVYAYLVPEINAKEIITINTLVNSSENLHRGFKSTNNGIQGENGLPFETCPKELVGYKINELLYKYNNEWSKDIPRFDYDESLNAFYSDIELNLINELNVNEVYNRIEKRREEYNYAICLREAKFHIEFERIHPFEDGNGRTGRIILNKHLIDNGFAPIIIASEIREEYIKCINNPNKEEGAKELAQLIQTLSSAQKSDMVSLYRNFMGIRPDELSNSERGEKNTENIIDDDEQMIEEDTKLYRIRKSNYLN